MNDINSNYSRILKNTLILYLRMLLTMGISFYTTRLVLEALGVDDYGIYNVLGGLVALCSIITGSLNVGISRYITIEIGRGNIERLRLIFSSSIIIMAIVSLIVAIIMEFGGVWFIDNKMTLPIDKIYDSKLALQCFILSFGINLICVPYNACIIAHEKITAFAYIGIISVLLKLIVALIIFIPKTNKLIYYSVFNLVVDIILRIIYGIYCKRNFPEASFKWTINKSLVKDMSKFTGWAFLGNGAVVLKDQGVNIVINVFCGLVVNAARGLANQVNGAVSSLIVNFQTAVNPQIIKSYASGDYFYMNNLICKSGKLSFCILYLLVFPISVNIDYILGIWLKDVPEYTAPFVVLILIYSLFDALGGPFYTAIMACGNIKKYNIALSMSYLMNFLTSYILLKNGFSPIWVFIVNIIYKVIVFIWSVVLIDLIVGKKNKIDFPKIGYFKGVICRIAIMVIISLGSTVILKEMEYYSFIQFMGIFCLEILFIAMVSYLIVLNNNERKFIKNKTISLISHMRIFK